MVRQQPRLGYRCFGGGQAIDYGNNISYEFQQDRNYSSHSSSIAAEELGDMNYGDGDSNNSQAGYITHDMQQPFFQSTQI